MCSIASVAYPFDVDKLSVRSTLIHVCMSKSLKKKLPTDRRAVDHMRTYVDVVLSSRLLQNI